VLFDKQGRMFVPKNKTIRTRIMAELHDSTTGVHCGRDRMIASAKRRFIWHGMTEDIDKYVSTCDSCQRNKPSKQLTPGLLMPVPVPSEPFMHWTTDTLTGIPRTKEGYDAIQVFVCRVTKYIRLAAVRKTDTSADFANTVISTIVRNHGVPMSILSDRDPRITAAFWKEMQKVMGTEVIMSTAHHPQTDGQSENAFGTLIPALRSYVNTRGNDWATYLPVYELATNAIEQTSTGVAPFLFANGANARLPIDCVLDGLRPSTLPSVNERAAIIKSVLQQARSRVEQAQARQKRNHDKQHRSLAFKVGDQVLVSTEGLSLTKHIGKLTARFIGPFSVIEVVNANAYRVQLPPLLSTMHPVININRLKVYRDGSALFPDRPVRHHQPPAVDADTNGEAQWEVECALAQRGSGNRRQLLVRWKGYGAEHDQWKSRSELVRSAPDIVAQYDARQQGVAGQ
jgi:hypothetical protein